MADDIHCSLPVPRYTLKTTFLLNGDKSDMYERAKKCYEDRKNRGLRRTTSILEQRMNGEKIYERLLQRTYGL